MRTVKSISVFAASLAIFSIGLFGEDRMAAPSASQAAAEIGRPLTSMSYAGVARRTTRRAMAVGAGAAAATAATTCAQFVDAYGRVVTRC